MWTTGLRRLNKIKLNFPSKFNSLSLLCGGCAYSHMTYEAGSNIQVLGGVQRHTVHTTTKLFPITFSNADVNNCDISAWYHLIMSDRSGSVS